MATVSLRRLLLIPGSLLLALACLIYPTTSFAHEHRDVGEITMTVGFITEPAIQGDTNGVWLEVMKGEEPVTGLADTLKVEVIFGDQSREFDLVPAWGEDGVYEAVFIPTQPGDYSFRFVGQIDGVDVDETFTSSPEGFDSVTARTDLEFPAATEEDGQGSSVLTLGMPLAAATVLAVGVTAWSLRRHNS